MFRDASRARAFSTDASSSLAAVTDLIAEASSFSLCSSFSGVSRAPRLKRSLSTSFMCSIALRWFSMALANRSAAVAASVSRDSESLLSRARLSRCLLYASATFDSLLKAAVSSSWLVAREMKP
jgi:hypothetical protein